MTFKQQMLMGVWILVCCVGTLWLSAYLFRQECTCEEIQRDFDECDELLLDHHIIEKAWRKESKEMQSSIDYCHTMSSATHDSMQRVINAYKDKCPQ